MDSLVRRFLPGILWLLHKHTGAVLWCRHAEQYSRSLEPRQHDRTVHDLGFLFLPTYLRWYHLTGDAALRQVLINAGRTLALRQQKGGYLASFIGPQSLFIDIMMNVGLIFWAAQETGAEHLREIALEHCRTTARYLVRPDGGTAHEGVFDVDTGRFLWQRLTTGLEGDQHVVARPGLGHLRVHSGPSSQRRKRVPHDGTTMCRLLSGPTSGRNGSVLGL